MAQLLRAEFRSQHPYGSLQGSITGSDALPVHMGMRQNIHIHEVDREVNL